MRKFFSKYRGYRFTIYFIVLFVDYLVWRTYLNFADRFSDLLVTFRENRRNFNSTLKMLKDHDNENL